MQIKWGKEVGRPTHYCLDANEIRMFLDADDTLKGEGITPVTADLEAYEELIKKLNLWA